LKVAIGNIVALNAGDAAILVGTAESLRHALGPDLEITVYDPDAEAAARYYRGFRFRPSLHARLKAWAGEGPRLKRAALVLAAAATWRRRLGEPLRRRLPADLREAVEEYAASDLVLSSGGTYLMPNYDVKPKLFDLLVALALGRPLVMFTQSIGSFRGRRIGRLLGAALRRAKLLLVRDAASRRSLEELGVPRERIVTAADAAFALACPATRRSALGGLGRPLRVAMSVRYWPHFPDGAEAGMQRYLGAMARLTERLVREDGCEVTFVSTCQGMPEYWTDDAATAYLVLARLPEEVRRRVRVDRQHREPLALREHLREFDVAVATRLHFAILALCAGTPAMAVAYEFKTAELFGELGLGAYSCDIAEADGEQLAAVFRALSRNWEGEAPRVWAEVDRLRRSAFGAGEVVRQALAGPA